MIERDMRPTIDAWLREQGMLQTLYESRIFGNADVVGVQFAERVGRAIPPLTAVRVVELKISDIGGVLWQARLHREYPVLSYAAMPADRIERMRAGTLQRFAEAGVGLLAVAGMSVATIVSPQKSNTAWCDIPARLWRRIRSTQRNYSAARRTGQNEGSFR